MDGSMGVDDMERYRIGDGIIGDGGLTIMAGPCSLESLELGMTVAQTMKRLCRERGLLYVFKASFDKANRTSIHTWRGPGMAKGLEQLETIKGVAGVPILTDIHESYQADPVGRVADVIQIPAFLCRQTDLLVAAARTGKIVNIKKAQFLASDDMAYALGKCREVGNDRVILCERGTTMGYHRLVVDMTNIVAMRELGCPVMFDATHSVQRPGALGGMSGGDHALALPLARGAAAVGVDAIFAETHPDPKEARSDGPNMIPLDEMPTFLDQVLAVHETVRRLTREESA